MTTGTNALEKIQEITSVPKPKNVQVKVSIQPEYAHLIRNLAEGLRLGRLKSGQVVKLA